MIRRRRPGSRGFSLVESLVAVAVAATALSGFYGALSTGILLSDRAEAQAEQVLVATTILDRVGTVIPPVPGFQEQGRLNGHDWNLGITNRPTADMDLGPVREGELAVIFVTVQSRLEGGSPVTIRGIRYLERPL